MFRPVFKMQSNLVILNSNKSFTLITSNRNYCLLLLVKNIIYSCKLVSLLLRQNNATDSIV